MKFRGSLLCSLALFILMVLLLAAIWIDSYFWPESTTDVEYRLKGLWTTMGWLLAFGLSFITFIFLILLGWARIALVKLFDYLSKSEV